MKNHIDIEFTDYLSRPEILVYDCIKELVEFEDINFSSYFIEFRSISYYKKTINYKIRIHDISQGV